MSRERETVEYLKAAFGPADRMAIVLINRERQHTVQQLDSAEHAVTPEFQRWLRRMNAGGYNVYAHLQVLRPDAGGRRREDIAEVRHVYVDFDRSGKQAITALLARTDIPRPSWALETSHDRYQAIWRVDGLDVAGAEALSKGLARELGADPAATAVTQPSRVPGFANKNHPGWHWVTAERTAEGIRRPQEFPEALRVPQRPQMAERAYQEPAGRAVDGERRVPGDVLVVAALERVPAEGRNAAGFWLAQQLRDNRYSRSEAEQIMRSGYLVRVPQTDREGRRQRYVAMEMRASIESAYRRPAREPWPVRELVRGR